MPGVLGSASVPFIGCVTLLTAEILTILAMASPFWATYTTSDEKFCSTPPCKYWFGLWRKTGCDYGSTGPGREDCSRWNHPWYHDNWHHAVQGLESLAVIFFAFPLIVLPVYIYVALGLYYRCILAFSAFSVLLGTCCNIAGVIVFGVQIGSTDTWGYSWCLIVCVVGGGLGLIAFIILLIATINKPEFQPEKYIMSGFYVESDRNRMYVVETDEPVKIVYPVSEPGGHGGVVVTPPPGGHANPAMEADDLING